MKLENVQIEIRNKEHYEAVRKTLQRVWGFAIFGMFCAFCMALYGIVWAIQHLRLVIA